jgi:putative ABC transport system ATP-binding protein
LARNLTDLALAQNPVASDTLSGTGLSPAIMGPSGSDKSTPLHIMAGIIRPDEGQVLLRGEHFDKLGENRLSLSALRRKRFGFVCQSGRLLPELPAEENVAHSPSPRTTPPPGTA